MQYKVVFNKTKADVSEQTLMEVALKYVSSGQPLTPEALQAMANQLMEVTTTEKVFYHNEPLLARREAITHLKSLGEVVTQYNATGEGNYLAIKEVNGDLNSLFKTYSIFLYLVYQGEEMLIASSEAPTVDMVENLERECAIYNQNGYDIGGVEPVKMYIHELGRNVELLPDLMMNNA